MTDFYFEETSLGNGSAVAKIAKGLNVLTYQKRKQMTMKLTSQAERQEKKE